MLRRSLILLLALLLLGLAFTVGYSLLPVREPADLLADARALLQKGDAVAAAKLLEQAAATSSIHKSAGLRREVLRLQLAAHRAADLPQRALEDVENLILDGDTDLSFQLDRIYYLARLGEGERARRHAQEFVAAHPDHARGLELAGEACKVAYTPLLRDLSKRIRADLGASAQREGIAAFLEMVYRPDGDPGIEVARTGIEALYGREPRLRQAWPGVQEQVRAVRDQVQVALTMFQRALEVVGNDKKQRGNYFAAALNGVTYALQKAGRADDVTAQAEIYLATFDHAYRVEAAIAEATANYADGLYEAAVRAVERVLPPETTKAKLEGKTLGPQMRTLVVTKALSLYRLSRAEPLGELARVVTELHESRPNLAALPGLTWGLWHVLRGTRENVAQQLIWIADVMMREPAPQDGEDPLDLLMPLFAERAVAENRAAADLFAALDRWAEARPGNFEPAKLRARLQIRFGMDAAAMATAAALLQQKSEDEDALRLLAEASDLAYRASNQDGASLVAQCLQRNTDRPDSPPSPVCYLLCGEAALVQQRPWIARTCARLALDRFPWSTWPHLLLARAHLLQGELDTAADVLDRLLVTHPECDEAVSLAFATRTQAGLPVRDLLPSAVRAMPDSPAVLAELLRTAIDDRGPGALPLARRAVSLPDASAELLALAAHAIALEGDPIHSLAVLARAHTAKDRARPGAATTLLAATVACLLASAKSTPDADLLAAASRALAGLPMQGPDTARELAEAARELAAADRPETAQWILSQSLSLGDAIEVRDGQLYTLAGKLLLERGRLESARAHFTAAVAFDDGRDAAENLARLLALQGETRRAAAAHAMVETPTDPALALWLGSKDALALARSRSRENPGDLVAAVVEAMADPETVATHPAAELRSLPATSQREVLQVAMRFAERALLRDALASTETLGRQHPGSFALQLLHARALLANQRLQDAADMHARCFDAGCRSAVLYREVVLATETAGYVAPSAILAELRAVAATNPTSLPPSAMAAIALAAADDAERQGLLDVALKVRSETWRAFPGPSRATVEDATQLLQADLVVDAFELLGKLAEVGTDVERARARRHLYELATARHAELPGPTRNVLHMSAQQDLHDREAGGTAFAFLVASPKAFEGRPRKELEQFLDSGLRAACRGIADWNAVARAVATFQGPLGPRRTLELVEAVRRDFPSAPRLWLEHARLSCAVHKLDDGTSMLRRFQAFVVDPAFAIESVALIAQHRRLTPGDITAFESLPPETRTSPRARFVAGLVALRRGEGDKAEEHFAHADDQSPFGLFARAVANLMSIDKAGRARAKELLSTISERYPRSSEARNAGSFARQLGPN